MTEVRSARQSDFEAVSRLLLAAGLVPVDSGDFGPPYAVAEDPGGAIIGAAGIERYGDAGLLRSVVVSPDHRSCGIGASLTANRVAWAKAEGVRELYLLTTTAADYWKRFGFAAVDRADAPHGVAQSHEWLSACPATAVAMRLSL